MESTLTIPMAEFQDRLRFQLGYGQGENEDEIIRRSIDSGLRLVYTCPVLNGVQHNWSFLRPVGRLTLASGNQYADLPADFGGFEGKSLSVVGDNRVYPEVFLTASVEARYAGNVAEGGFPRLAELQPVKGTTATAGQRYRLRVWPQPEAAHTLAFVYYFHPNALTSQNPYVYGGPQHAEMFLAACLAEAELIVDGVYNGPQRQKFMERLAASVLIDRRMSPRTIGMMTDPSTTGGNWFRPRLDSGFIATFDGVVSE